MSTESQFDFRERESGGRERQERKNALCQHSLFFTHSDQKKNCISRSLVVAETLLGVHYCAIRGKKESSCLNVSGPSENITVVFIREQDKGATWEVGAYGASSLDVNWPNTCRRRRGRGVRTQKREKKNVNLLFRNPFIFLHITRTRNPDLLGE